MSLKKLETSQSKLLEESSESSTGKTTTLEFDKDDMGIVFTGCFVVALLRWQLELTKYNEVWKGFLVDFRFLDLRDIS